MNAKETFRRLRPLCPPAVFNDRLGDRAGVIGHVTAELRDSSGRLIGRWSGKNLVTDNGDAYLAKKAYSGSPPTAMAGMKLGSGSTAAAKSGAGSYVGTGDYVSGSAKAFDDTFPKQGSAANVIQYKRTYAAGEATGTIRRAAIVDNTTDAAEADATHTLATYVFAADIPKGAGDSLAITWDVTLTGA